jgi:hypothetical protein
MLQRRICGVTAFLVFLFWLSLTLSFFELPKPLITNTEAAQDHTIRDQAREPDHRLA